MPKYGELLGGHMIGANVTEMIAELVLAKKLESTGHEIFESSTPASDNERSSDGGLPLLLMMR
jgi:pyruvate/2-oxoglutarate dehydrogenase complex dihydrolipoamide dehydrogenase (E3) component